MGILKQSKNENRLSRAQGHSSSGNDGQNHRIGGSSGQERPYSGAIPRGCTPHCSGFYKPNGLPTHLEFPSHQQCRNKIGRDESRDTL